jgi:hypothetical protein
VSHSAKFSESPASRGLLRRCRKEKPWKVATHVGSGREIERRRDAGLHFIRSLLGERQCQNTPPIDALPHQVNEAAGKGRCLTRTGTCQNELDVFGSRSGALLYGIEGVHMIVPSMTSPRPSDTIEDR